MPVPVAIGCDIETTGLENNSLILEVALVIFDENFQEINHISRTIHHDKNTIISACVDFVLDMHTSNGLIDDANNTPPENTVESVEKELVQWIEDNTNGTKLPMLGNSITFDRGVLERNMPHLLNAFHYRSIDATSLRLVADLVSNKKAKRRKETGASHRGYEDLLDSAHSITDSISRIKKSNKSELL